MTGAVEFLQQVQLALFVALGAAALLHWRRYRGSAAGWLAVTFGLLAAVFIAARLLPTYAPGSDTPLWYDVAIRLVLAALVLFPYALARFTRAFREPRRRIRITTDVIAAVTVVATLALPPFPAEGEPRPWWMTAWMLLLLLEWTYLSVFASVRLWRGGRGQPPVARRRMRLLSGGAVVFNVVILVAISVSLFSPQSRSHIKALQRQHEAAATDLLTVVLGILSAPLFYLGFAPPAVLRAAWRRPTERSFRDAETGLMSAVTASGVAGAMLPFLAEVFGGQAAVLADRDGEVIGAHGLTPERARAMALRLLDGDFETSGEVMAVPLRNGIVAVRATPFTPYFGAEEVQLLHTLGAFTDLALERALLFGREQEARVELERTHRELEALVYGVSHDLKSPVISMMGYAELLRSDYGEGMDADGRHFLDRMVASGTYMQHLLSDLLELSRIGRVQTDAEDVDVDQLVHEITDDLARAHPRARFEIEPLPRLYMNRVRVRQLFTNLLENALRHGGRDDITVRIDARPREGGGVVITIADDGRGIPPAYRDKVFGIFQRLEGPGDAEGTGIGLAFIRKIVEHARGEVVLVDSDAGARFELRLPADAVATTSAEVTVGAAP